MIDYFRAVVARLRGLFRDRKADRELDEEIEGHLRLLTERYVRQGIMEGEVALAARRQFGNVTLLKEDHREIPLANVATMEDLIDDSFKPQRFNTFLMGLFAALALLLAVVGLYGVLSYMVAQRKHEIGVRMALGAQTRDVIGLVVRQGMTLTLIGMAIGLIAAPGLTRLIETLLFDVSATDPLTFLVIALMFAMVALLACYLPARRVTKVDPLQALRHD